MEHPCGSKRWSGHVTILVHEWGPWRGVPFDSEERHCRLCQKIEIRMLKTNGDALVKKKKTKV